MIIFIFEVQTVIFCQFLYYGNNYLLSFAILQVTEIRHHLSQTHQNNLFFFFYSKIEN